MSEPANLTQEEFAALVAELGALRMAVQALISVAPDPAALRKSLETYVAHAQARMATSDAVGPGARDLQREAFASLLQSLPSDRPDGPER